MLKLRIPLPYVIIITVIIYGRLCSRVSNSSLSGPWIKARDWNLVGTTTTTFEPYKEYEGVLRHDSLCHTRLRRQGWGLLSSHTRVS